MVGQRDELEDWAEQRAAYVQSLRERYLAGTLDEVLVPEDADVTELLADIEEE